MRAVVVGSGAGGATAARELASRGFEVLVLEAGSPFKPFTRRLGWAEPLRRLGLIGEGTFTRLFPHMWIERPSEGLMLVRGVTTGGSTALSCGNMVRAERGLKEIGLDLKPEFEELEALLGVMPVPRERWRPVTQRMFDVAEELGLDPRPTPKAVDMDLCASCGLCELGCATGAKWDARRFLSDLEEMGGRVESGSPVGRVLVEEGEAKGVELERSSRRVGADVVVLAAGGIGTAQILSKSGYPPRGGLWADVVLTLGGALDGADQIRETPMVWYAERGGYILSPYPDILSHWFHGPWRRVPLRDRVGLMAKLADEPNGYLEEDGTVVKALTDLDRERLREAMDLASEVMEAAGVTGPFVEGLANGGHLGGTVPLSSEEVPTMRPSWLPDGLWVADLSLVPVSQGLPTILTTAAIALRVARRIAEETGA